MASSWGWVKSGLALAFVLLAAIILVKPVGVSTQYVITDGIIWDSVDDSVVTADPSSKTGFTSENAYLAKSGGKYAKSVAKPINYGYIFVFAMVAGGFIGMFTSRKNAPAQETPKEKEPMSFAYYGKAFLAGALVLFGARLAGGCTSGHMMSGIMQTSLSGFLFTAGLFAAAVPVAFMLYRKKSA